MKANVKGCGKGGAWSGDSSRSLCLLATKQFQVQRETLSLKNKVE